MRTENEGKRHLEEDRADVQRLVEPGFFRCCVALQLVKQLFVDEHQILDVGEQPHHHVELQEALRVFLRKEARQVQPLVVQLVQVAEVGDVCTLRHENLLRHMVARRLRLLHGRGAWLRHCPQSGHG